jgi:2-C-methyl-D-erythritol 4-phosphate cytidylyltransferase
MMEKYVLITAGGSGTRMGAEKPKQFIELAGKPILMHSFYPFLRFSASLHFVLALPEAHMDAWQQLCRQYRFFTQHQLVISGPTRFHSVKNGLRHVPDDALVAIHDGVRPLVSPETISRVFHHAEKYGNAVPVITPGESVRIAEKAHSHSFPRSRVRLVQTPQCFHSSQIKKAYNQSYREEFTDDAGVLETQGERIFMVEGDKENIKITTPEDLRYAEALLASGQLGDGR